MKNSPAIPRTSTASRLLTVSVLAGAVGVVSAGCFGGTAPTEGSRQADVSQIADCIGPFDEATSGGDLEVSIGAALSFSGPGAVFGELQSSGIELAVEHIEALGGPTIEILEKDIKSGEPTAGVQAVRDFAAADIPLVLSSYIGNLGTMQEPLAQNEILAMDPGGGTGVFAQGLDYFWGTRAVNANDNFGGVVEYIKSELPDAQKIASVVIDQGPANELVQADGDAAIEAGGLEPGVFLTSPVGTTDWSSILQQLREDDPDVIWAQIVGDDPGYFMKQYATSGLEATVFIFEYTEPAADIAAGAYDDVYFAFDNFDVEAAGNCWTETFIEGYRNKFGKDPDYYAANYYETTFAMWDLIRRVLAEGGDVQSGAALQAALESNPEFASLYGGDADTPGVMALDPETHTLTSRLLSISRLEDGALVTLATSDIGGKDFALR